jgi:hypothetical protein
MSHPARIPLRLPPFVVWPIIAVCLASIVYLISFAIPMRLAGQAYLIIVILLAFRYWPPMTRLVSGMPVPHRVVFGLLVLGMIAGHFTLNSRAYFPFVSWAIFPLVNETNPVTCNEFIATTESGHKVRLLVEQLFPSIVQIAPAEAFDDQHYYPAATTQHLVRAMARMYNEHHANDPVLHVDVMRFAVQLHPPANESRAHPSCELLKSYDISSGQ